MAAARAKTTTLRGTVRDANSFVPTQRPPRPRTDRHILLRTPTAVPAADRPGRDRAPAPNLKRPPRRVAKNVRARRAARRPSIADFSAYFTAQSTAVRRARTAG